MWCEGRASRVEGAEGRGEQNLLTMWGKVRHEDIRKIKQEHADVVVKSQQPFLIFFFERDDEDQGF